MEKPNPEIAESLPLTFLSTCNEKECTILCLEIDLASCGATLEEAEESLKGLAQMYIEDCLAEEGRVVFRPVPLEALLEFLGPEISAVPRPLTSRRLSVPIHASV
jgi:hypothetical protein